MRSQPTILVVDGHPQLRQLLELALSDEGYRVASAATSSDALAYLAAGPVDLILTDSLTPGIDGLDWLQGYHQALPPPHAPVIWLTVAPYAPAAPVELIPMPFD